MPRWRAGLLVVALAAAAGCRGPAQPAAEGEAVVPAPEPSGPEVTAPARPDLPGGALVRCESPDGFAVSAPATWATSEGDGVGRCGLFNPEPFDVSSGTDGRVAAIAVYVDRVLFSTASAPQNRRDEVRMVTTVDGRPAVRLSYRSNGLGLYPEGMPITSYFVDVAPPSGQQSTLVMNTLGLPAFDYEANTVVLDRMFQTLELTGIPAATGPTVVAARRMGTSERVVTAAPRRAGEADGNQVCLAVPPDGEPACAGVPAPDQVRPVVLGGPEGPFHAGVTGAGVWRVDVVTPAGETHSYLPAPVAGADARAYAAHGAGGFQRLVLYDVTSAVLATVEPQG